MSTLLGRWSFRNRAEAFTLFPMAKTVVAWLAAASLWSWRRRQGRSSRRAPPALLITCQGRRRRVGLLFRRAMRTRSPAAHWRFGIVWPHCRSHAAPAPVRVAVATLPATRLPVLHERQHHGFGLGRHWQPSKKHKSVKPLCRLHKQNQIGNVRNECRAVRTPHATSFGSCVWDFGMVGPEAVDACDGALHPSATW